MVFGIFEKKEDIHQEKVMNKIDIIRDEGTYKTKYERLKDEVEELNNKIKDIEQVTLRYELELEEMEKVTGLEQLRNEYQTKLDYAKRLKVELDIKKNKQYSIPSHLEKETIKEIRNIGNSDNTLDRKSDKTIKCDFCFSEVKDNKCTICNKRF